MSGEQDQPSARNPISSATAEDFFQNLIDGFLEYRNDFAAFYESPMENYLPVVVLKRQLRLITSRLEPLNEFLSFIEQTLQIQKDQRSSSMTDIYLALYAAISDMITDTENVRNRFAQAVERYQTDQAP